MTRGERLAAAQKIDDLIERAEALRDNYDLHLMKIRIEIAKLKAQQLRTRDVGTSSS